jgi:phospholipid transport system substrate-binding protein
MKLTSRLRVLLCALLLLALPVPVLAGTTAEGFLRAKQGELTALMKQGESEAVERKVGQTFDDMLDYRALAKESLREFWDERTDKERAEFEAVLRQLVQNAYRRNLRKTLDYDVQYAGETKVEKGVVVRTVAKHRTNKREEPLSLDYALHQVDGHWRVYDIITEGSSLVQNYRNQFRRVIKKKGFDELLRRMREKLAEEEA